MTHRIRPVAALVLAAAALIGSPVLASPAAAATAQPAEPDSATQLGSITFYDKQGVQVTGGLITALPSAEYAVASTPDPQGSANVKATLYGYAAKANVAQGSWGGQQLSASTPFPNTTGPSNVTSTPNPVVWMGKPSTISSSGYAQDSSFADLQRQFNNAGDAYAGIYQIRIKTANNIKWWAADIQIAGNNWTQIYPTPPTKTTPKVGLTASPAGSVYRGQSVTFTASVSDNAAGTVSFTDGPDVISGCGAQAVSSSGTATCTTNALRAGNRSITATFTPTDTSAFQSNASAPLAYLVKDKPIVTGPTVSGTPRVGQTVSCAASADDSSATHATTWFVNGTQVATGDNYGIGEGDYNKALNCSVTFTNPAGATSAASDAVNVGVGPALRALRLPRFRAALVSGKRAYVVNGSYAPAATSYAYQWSVNGRAVRGATRSYFTVPRKSRGKVVAVRVVARRYAYADSVVVVRAKVRK